MRDPERKAEKRLRKEAAVTAPAPVRPAEKRAQRKAVRRAAPAEQVTVPEPPERSRAAAAGTAGGTQTSGSGIDPEEYRYQDAVKVTPMLALRSSNSQLAEEPSWSSLSSLEGYRFCFGQMNPSDGSYLMYGYNLTALDIKVTAAGEFAASVGLQDTTGKKVMVSGGADSPGNAEVEGPYENPFTERRSVSCRINDDSGGIFLERNITR